MIELTTTRANHLVDPALHVWGWEIPVYLFLGGLVAGMMIISGYFLFSGRCKNTRSACFVLPGPEPRPALARHARALPRPRAQALRLAALHHLRAALADVLGRLDPAAGLSGAHRQPAAAGARAAARRRCRRWASSPTGWSARPALLRWIGAMNMVWGGLLGIYTGVLLSARSARDRSGTARCSDRSSWSPASRRPPPSST